MIDIQRALSGGHFGSNASDQKAKRAVKKTQRQEHANPVADFFGYREGVLPGSDTAKRFGYYSPYAPARPLAGPGIPTLRTLPVLQPASILAGPSQVVVSAFGNGLQPFERYQLDPLSPQSPRVGIYTNQNSGPS